MTLTPRARVLEAINHQETNLVPYCFHAVPAVWTKCAAHYGLRDHHEAMAFIGQHIVKIGSDFNFDPWAADVGKVELTPSGGPVHTDADHEGLLTPTSSAACGIAATACRIPWRIRWATCPMIRLRPRY